MRRVLSLSLCLLSTACASRHAGPPQHVEPSQDYPGYLESSEKLGRPFVVQQHLSGRYGEHQVSLNVVVQLASEKLVLVGLTPFGSRAFVMTQDGRQITFEKFIDRDMPFDPSYVLNDVHRAFFRGLAGPRADGVYSEEQHDERVIERWLNGQVVERRFARLDGTPSGEIVVQFKGAPNPVVAPEIALDNAWFGYRLTIQSSDQRYLD